MILLDTDHLSVLMDQESTSCALLEARMEAAGSEEFAVTIISVEEQMRGWLAVIHRLRDVHKQIPAYLRLARLFDFLSDWTIVEFDVLAAEEFERLRKQKVRIGSMDLKIAAIALAQDSLLLTGNLRDFRQVSGLRIESWL